MPTLTHIHSGNDNNPSGLSVLTSRLTWGMSVSLESSTFLSFRSSPSVIPQHSLSPSQTHTRTHTQTLLRKGPFLSHSCAGLRVSPLKQVRDKMSYSAYMNRLQICGRTKQLWSSILLEGRCIYFLSTHWDPDTYLCMAIYVLMIIHWHKSIRVCH